MHLPRRNQVKRTRPEWKCREINAVFTFTDLCPDHFEIVMPMRTPLEALPVRFIHTNDLKGFFNRKLVVLNIGAGHHRHVSSGNKLRRRAQRCGIMRHGSGLAYPL
ncbi:hypothetical protein ElyMa_006018800 [Elysia marginata]|uniref:Uncharacterized protein n=1 Tax=Elysia marginata TaxID=1093978 RepID=A0AAV4GIF1_9GAST|nr:hypothetical protein ElyMa_006018800 [Elysia marginata]